jgi:phage-related minor tail protein
MADDVTDGVASDLALMVDRVDGRMQDLSRSANAFSRIMTTAFAQSVTGARGFDDTLKSLGLRLSGLAVQSALKPLASLLTNSVGALFGSGLALPQGSTIKPFADGGVIGTPGYFPIASGVGLAGEAGPEAILPLSRGPDGQLGVAAGGGAGAPRVTINIATPDAESFRRSEVFVTGQIARAVARGQRGL